VIDSRFTLAGRFLTMVLAKLAVGATNAGTLALLATWRARRRSLFWSLSISSI
jgi:hypothetical protein